MTEDQKHNLQERVSRPLLIGGKEIKNRLFLAPMAGLGHIAFRELVEGFGGYGLLFTGMCSAKSVPTENRHKSPVFSWRDQELERLVCQIFGPDPDIMAAAARRVQEEGFFGVDLNFGCSVAAICKTGSGAALLKEPDRAVAITAAVRKAVSIPLFVKFRIGWADAPGDPVRLAKRFEEAGADAIVFHPRIAPDRRSRPPRWDYIRQIKEAVSIPVFGNGNLFDREDCLKMLETTGCDGLSLGRIAIARPWIFSAISRGIDPDAGVYRECAVKTGELLLKHYPPTVAIKLFKKLAIYFMANFAFGNKLHGRLRKAENMEQVFATLGEIFETTPAVLKRPNMNMFV